MAHWPAMPSNNATHSSKVQCESRAPVQRQGSHCDRRDPQRQVQTRRARSAQQGIAHCAEDPARYQLLFQRTIPGFEPSSESFKISEDNQAELGELLARCGVSDPEMRALAREELERRFGRR